MSVKPIVLVSAEDQRRRQFWIIIALFLGYGYFNTMRGVFPQQMRTIALDMNISMDRIGLPNSLFSAAYGFGKFFTSMASDYVPCAEFHAFGLFLSGLAVAALGACSDFNSIAWLWGLQGLLQAFGWPLLARVVVTELPEESRAQYWGILSMAGNVGNMLAPYGMVVAAYCGLSWRGAFMGAGASAVVMSVIVWRLLCGGRSRGEAAAILGTAHSSQGEAKRSQNPCQIFASPVILALMLCNMLSFGSSKCTKEWGGIYMRSTHLAASNMEVATLMFWSEVGGSVGAVGSGFISAKLGGRHGLTCMMSALLASASLGVLVMSTMGVGAFAHFPLPFGVACVLQAASLAGINGVRTLAGLHGAEVASRFGKVGMTNAWLEGVGQMGSVLAGQPLGAVSAYVSTLVDGEHKSSLDSSAGGVTFLVALCAASVIMALLNFCLLPQEERRVGQKTLKVE